VHGITKDQEADAMISQAISAQPDAGYLLVQNILLMQHTLTELNARISQLESSNANAQSSFLGAQNQSAVKSYFSNQNQQPQATQPMQQPAGQYGYQQNQAQNSGMGSFLRNAGTTAAGVAGGMLLFEGISHLFGGSSGGSFMGGGMPMNETIVNNNYFSDSSAGDFIDSSDVDSAFDAGGSDSFGDDLF
jgi:hypothetical protein